VLELQNLLGVYPMEKTTQNCDQSRDWLQGVEKEPLLLWALREDGLGTRDLGNQECTKRQINEKQPHSSQMGDCRPQFYKQPPPRGYQNPEVQVKEKKKQQTNHHCRFRLGRNPPGLR